MGKLSFKYLSKEWVKTLHFTVSPLLGDYKVVGLEKLE